MSDIQTINLDNISLIELGKAITNHGFFKLVGNDITEINKSRHLIEGEVKKLLTLDHTILEKYIDKVNLIGYTNLENLNQSQKSWIYRPEGKFPIPMPHTENFWIEYNKIASKLINPILFSIGIDIETDYDKLYKNLALCLYPPSEKVGLNEHTDFGLITLLMTNAPGLEIYNELNNQWFSPKISEDSIIVNIGDWMRLMAKQNGKIISAGKHRVTTVDKEKISLVLFSDAPLSDKIKLDDGKEITYDEFLKIKFNENYNGEYKDLFNS